MKVLITTIGFQKYGNSNNIWLAVKTKKFIPEKIILLLNEDPKIQKNKISNIQKIKEFLPEVEIQEKLFKEEIKNYKEVLSNTLDTNANNQVAIDVTLGRKYMSIISVHLAIKHKINHVFYTLYDGDYNDKPISQIPITKVKLIDFMENEN